MSQDLKLAIIGGGAFRTPRLLYGLIRHADSLKIDRIDLFDPDRERLHSMVMLCRHIAAQLGSAIDLVAQSSLAMACQDAAFVLLTYRIGGEIARAYDERVALNHGVLGQETVGPGGFFMALRSLPTTLEYVEAIRTVAPDAWIINFTNPAGIVTEAVSRYGDRRFVGVCDTPYHLQLEIAEFLHLSADEIRVESVGLNHLGWFQRVWHRGEDLLPRLLDQVDELVHSVRPLSFFSSEYLRNLGVLPTEYVYFYLHGSDVVARIREQKSRGEQIQQVAEMFFPRLRDLVTAQDMEAAWQEYGATITNRSNSYLAEETASAFPRGLNPESLFQSEGYEGVAIRVMEGVTGKAERTVILNTPSYGIAPLLEPGDVVEATCFVDRHGIVPLAPTRTLPDSCMDLMRQTKHFEILTIAAAQSQRLEDAVGALTANPLMGGDGMLSERLIRARMAFEGSPVFR